MIRISWLLEHPGGKTVRDASHLIRLPDGYIMPEKTQHVTGIYDWMLKTGAFALDHSVAEFSDALIEARQVVAFGWQHHRKVLERSYRYLQAHVPVWPSTVCAMINGAQIIQIPAMKPGQTWKWPSFVEAHEKLVGRPWYVTTDPVRDGLTRLHTIRLLMQQIDALDQPQDPRSE